MNGNKELVVQLWQLPYIRVILCRGWRLINAAAPIDGLVYMMD